MTHDAINHGAKFIKWIREHGAPIATFSEASSQIFLNHLSRIRRKHNRNHILNTLSTK